MAHQYIYTMQNLRRVHPPNKECVLKGIYLSFYPGAKIGVLGSNGSGKSTLLRDHGRRRQGFWRRQGGRRDPDRLPAAGAAARSHQDGAGERQEAVANTKKLLTRFDEVNLKLGEEMTPEAMEKLLEEQGKLQDAIEAANGWDLDRTLEIAMDALRLPPSESAVDKPSGGERRRGGALPRAARGARSPSHRRADQPSRRRERGLAGAPPARVPGNHRGRHARSLLPRQRRRLDPGARPRGGNSLGGEPSSCFPEQRGSGSRPRRRLRSRTLRRWRASSRKRRLAARGSRVEGASGGVRRAPCRGAAEARGDYRDRHPARAAPGRRGGQGRAPPQGLRRQGPHRGSQLQPSRVAASSAPSAPTAPEKPRSFA